MKHAREDYNRFQDPANKIAEDEPVFLVRAKDINMIPTLNAWITSAEGYGVDKNMVQKVIDFKQDVIDWQKKNGCKVPDL